jgi:hypothetical protein
MKVIPTRRGLIYFNNLSFFSVCILFGLLPFHYYITWSFPYYRELLALIFFIIIMANMTHYIFKFLSWEFPYILLFVFAWSFFILAAYIVDPGISIYGEDITRASLQLSKFSPGAYVLRNSFLYFPLLILIYLRGLNKREFIFLLSIVVFCAPLSIISLYRYYGMENFTSVLIQLDESGKSGLPYNTYIPYLSFVFISGIYLLYSVKGYFPKIVFLILSSFIFGVIILSTSRQTVLFCILGGSGFSLSQKSKLSLIISIFILFGIAYYFLSFSDALGSLYLTPAAFETTRFEIMKNGLQKLDAPGNWFFGKGLTSVIFSGPHNNYIRTIQRIGIFGMLLTFFPFIYAFLNINMKIIKYWNLKIFDRNLAWFITMGIFFTLYHSFFGYPHSDAFNNPFVWLGLSIYLVMKKDLIALKPGNMIDRL